MKNRLLTHLLALAVAGAAVAAHAADDAQKKGGDRGPTAEKRQQHGFKHLDANQDGRIDRAEAEKSKRLSKRFDALDTDKDGSLTPQELQADKQRHARNDGKGDGKGRHKGKGHGKPEASQKAS